MKIDVPPQFRARYAPLFVELAWQIIVNTAMQRAHCFHCRKAPPSVVLLRIGFEVNDVGGRIKQDSLAATGMCSTCEKELKLDTGTAFGEGELRI